MTMSPFQFGGRAMRKSVVLSLTLLLVLLGAVSVMAKPHGATSKYHRMHGDIDSVDTAAQSFTVKHGNDTSTFKTDSSTKYRGAGKEIGFADLKVGDDVRVSFTENGSDKMAARVDVVHGKKMTADPNNPH
jgi:hypothetical protein